VPGVVPPQAQDPALALVSARVARMLVLPASCSTEHLETRLQPEQAPGFEEVGVPWQPPPLGAPQPFGTAPSGAGGQLGWSRPLSPSPPSAYVGLGFKSRVGARVRKGAGGLWEQMVPWPIALLGVEPSERASPASPLLAAP